ncbi:MAG TPA: alkaline phosphatase D family protein [Flavobacteriales bacterium]|nr:alkaline phosphatase D family protein [Flavobacteriales bacterium]
MTRTACLTLVLIAARVFAQDTVQVFWSGALTPHSIRVNARISAVTDSVRLVACEVPCNSDPLISDYAVADSAHDFVAALALGGLQPDRPYSYRFEVNGTLDTSSAHVGRFTTPRDGPASYSFVVGSCNSDGAHPVWQAMREKHPLFFLSSGDIHYRDPNNGADIDVHRDPYRVDVLSRSPMKELLHDMPMAYVWDDHDFCGNGSDASSSGKLNAARAYRDYVPHYFLSHPTSVYQAFTIGRVHFILSDLRSGKSTESMMDIEQFVWLQNQLRYARDHGLVAAWVSSLTWNSIGYPENWGSQPEERTLLNDFLFHENVENMFIMSGDAHMLAIDDGTDADFSSAHDLRYKYPILQAAAIARGGSYKGGTFNQGGYFQNPDQAHGQFGEVLVDDDGEQVCITLNGWRTDSMSANVTLMNSYTFCRTPPMVGIAEVGVDDVFSITAHDERIDLRWSGANGVGSLDLIDITGRITGSHNVNWNDGRASLPDLGRTEGVIIVRAQLMGRTRIARTIVH